MGQAPAPAKGHEQRRTRRHGREYEWQVRGGFDEPLAREMTACQEVGQRGTRHERNQQRGTRRESGHPQCIEDIRLVRLDHNVGSITARQTRLPGGSR